MFSRLTIVSCALLLATAQSAMAEQFLLASVADAFHRQFIGNSGCDAGGCDTCGCDTCGCDAGCDALGCDAYASSCHCESCCVECNDCCCPCWTVAADVMALRRTPPGSQGLTVPGGIEQWNAADMRFDYEVGPRIRLERQLGQWHSIELNYFGIDSHTATKSRTGVFANVLGPGFNYFVAPGNVNQFNYSADLHSLEANLRHQWRDGITLLAGFRWLEVSEDFHAFLDGGLTYSLATINHLYGFQIGADATIHRFFDGRLRADAFAKAGVFYNDGTVTGVSTGLVAPAGDATDSGSDVAFVGETGLLGVYQLRNNLYLRAGYQVLWIDGIATAPNQLPTVNTQTGVATLNTTYSAFYHGGFLGLIATF